MKLNSFRELLFRKAEGFIDLQNLIKTIDESFILDALIKAEEQPHKNTGIRAPHVVSFVSQAPDIAVTHIRDALAHHVSHHKAALKTMHESQDQETKNNARAAADKHLEKIVPLMHLASQFPTHAKKLDVGFKYENMRPWETNYVGHEGNKSGDKETKGLSRRPNKKGEGKVPNFRYLEMRPHQGDPSYDSKHENSAYPFEAIQFGNSNLVREGKAHLHTHDPGKVSEFVPHAFDSHPIMKSLDQKDWTDAHTAMYAKDLGNWLNGEGKTITANIRNRLKGAKESDPNFLDLDSQLRGSHHYEGLPILGQPDHVKAWHDAQKVKPSIPEEAEYQPISMDQNISENDLPPQLRSMLNKPQQEKEDVSSLKPNPNLLQDVDVNSPPSFEDLKRYVMRKEGMTKLNRANEAKLHKDIEKVLQNWTNVHQVDKEKYHSGIQAMKRGYK